jgi:ABC-2 type transport system permease protein
LFPSHNLPTWLTVLNRIDPLTYAVDPLRRLVFDHLQVTPAVRASIDAGVSWNGWRVPTLLEVGVIAAMGLIMLSIAIFAFSRSE